ncbi:MAG TPA: lysophospholipid acyltransferase family protein [Candidatus Limnocylindria bacterium]|nr:lysophospholipid acyltransferase family protein [Candidatus Limnocylindria bacterium]
MRSAGLAHAAERALPRMPAALVAPVAELIGTVAFAAQPVARAAVRENLSIVAPDRSGAASVRRVFVEQARNYLEIFKIPRIDRARLRAMVDKPGWEHFLAAHEQGRGVIVASAHLGPISLVGQVLTAHGYDVVLPVETERSEFQRAVNRARAAMGLHLVSTDTPLAVYRALKAGRVFGLLADRAVTGVGEHVSFFGRDALLPSAHVALALRTGAPLIPAFSLREGRQLVARFEPRLELPSTGDRAADVREGVRRWANVLERYVRRAPEQWTVFEPFWGPGG